MLKLYFDIDGVVRDIETPTLGGPQQIWVKEVKGMKFIDYVTKHRKAILTNTPETEYCKPLQTWYQYVGPKYVTFLSMQPKSWRPYTDKWIKERFPKSQIVYTDSPEEKMKILIAADAFIVEDYPLFDSYDRIALIERGYNKKCKCNTWIRDTADFMLFVAWAFVCDFERVVTLCHDIAKSKGWWETTRNDGELIALMHSELSEGLEALRHQEDKYNNITEELADCCIRIFDYCAARKLNFSGAFAEKLIKNMSRPYRHGKKF